MTKRLARALSVALLLSPCLGPYSGRSFAASSAASANDSASADGIMAVKENGRTVYVNAPKERPARASSAATNPVRRASVLVYWSSKDHRWKPVPPPSPMLMKAARTAAEEVASYVGSLPSSAKPNASPRVSPNYRDLARGRIVTTAEIDQAIESSAKQHGVDANLVRAIIKAESNFNPKALSRKGAMGLMQLMPDTARSLNVTNPFDPTQNVDAGVRYFKNLMKNYRGDVRLSLAAYNAGAGAVARSNGVPKFRETQNYVKQITEMYWNGMPATTLGVGGRGSASPARMFRNAEGKLVITNED
jgi:soluble lytic murein transglycosylase-like protein